jgi:hypothetical protein
MLPKNLVLEETANPKDLDSLIELLETTFRVDHTATTLEEMELRPDGVVSVSGRELRMARDFLEGCAMAISMPLGYAYKITPDLFCENFARRKRDTAQAVTVCAIGDVAVGLVSDRRWRYRPARTAEIIHAIRQTQELKLRRATVAFAGVDVEFIKPGIVFEREIGDVIEMGVNLTASETGDRQLKASAYSYRLVCTNGATMADYLGVARWQNDPRMTVAGCTRNFLENVNSICGRLEGVASLYRRVADLRIPGDSLWNLRRRLAYLMPRANDADAILGMEAEERVELQQTLRARPKHEPTATTRWHVYDVHNRITHAAHGKPFRVRRSLQELGGQLLSIAASWPSNPSMN